MAEIYYELKWILSVEIHIEIGYFLTLYNNSYYVRNRNYFVLVLHCGLLRFLYIPFIQTV